MNQEGDVLFQFRAPFRVVDRSAYGRPWGAWGVASSDGWVICHSRSGAYDTPVNTRPAMDRIAHSLTIADALACLANPVVVSWKYETPVPPLLHEITIRVKDQIGVDVFRGESFETVLQRVADWLTHFIHNAPPYLTGGPDDQ